VGVLERPPQPALASDSKLQDLQLVEAAQRRVASETPVQLQSAQPLGEDGCEWFEPARAHVEPIHDRHKRLAVGLDLGADLGQLRSERSIALVTGAQRRANSTPAVAPARWSLR
jgi:hypothetical protein